MTDHDVVIVGAGPVGLLLACLLAQSEVDVLVCERRAQPGGGSRAIGIHRPGLDALDAAGVGAGVRREALALSGGAVRSRGRTLAALDFTEERPVLVLPQTRTDALLRARLGRVAPGSLHLGHTVRSIRDEEDFVRVTVDGGQGVREVTARVTVIADGVHSPFREALFPGSWAPRRGRGRYAMVDVPDPVLTDRAVLHCEPEGLVESFPVPGGIRRWVLRETRSGEFAAATVFREEVRRRTGMTPPIPDAAAPVSFHARQHAAHPLVRGRVVLVGDAAHEVSPIGGQGMNLGWIGAARLADGIRASLDRGRMDLGRYERRMSRSVRAAHRRSAFYMAMGAPASGLPMRAREALMATLGSPPLRTWTTGLLTMRGI
jgi:2-polyprenyl-6-methoxyphenol hydroxylase-like FAD-dependent oxidoreductase